MAERTIFLKKRPLRIEGNAAGTITPGHTVIQQANGEYLVGPPAGAAPIQKPLIVAFENELSNFNGASSSNHTIDTNYVVGDRVYMGILDPGAEWYALLPAAAAAIVVGDMLEYGGGGTLRKATTGAVITTALEAVDNSGGGTPARIIARAV